MSVKLPQYTVKAGDTLSRIAKSHETTTELLRSWNTHLRTKFAEGEKKRDWEGNWIYPGDSVTIVTPDENQRLIAEARKTPILGAKQFGSPEIIENIRNEEKPLSEILIGAETICGPLGCETYDPYKIGAMKRAMEAVGIDNPFKSLKKL